MGSYRVPRKRNIEKQALSTWYLHLTVLSKSASTSTSVEGMLEIEEQRNHEDKIKKARKEKRSERILEVDEKVRQQNSEEEYIIILSTFTKIVE
ncbi:11347_t:CDS:2 [Funneliformis geosporum]|nr:11347_t:CDS:2 [Funneliformis geosporum]